MIRMGVMAGAISLSSMCVGPGPDHGQGDDQDGVSSKGDVGGPPCDNDDWEPNDASDSAAAVPWDDVSSWNFEEFWDAMVVINAELCRGEDDWYFIPIAELGFDYQVVRVDGLVMGTSWCGGFESCGGDTLPESPLNTMAVEIFDANTMTLLATQVAANGRINLEGHGAQWGVNLLIHVHGQTPAAAYGYELHVDVRSYEGEDECEC